MNRISLINLHECYNWIASRSMPSIVQEFSSEFLHHHSRHGEWDVLFVSKEINWKVGLVLTVEVQIVAWIVPPCPTIIDGTIPIIPIIVTIIRGKRHSVVTPRGCLSPDVHDIDRVTCESRHFDLVKGCFVPDTECVVFHWIPRTIPHQKFNPQLVWSTVGQLVNLFQPKPEVSIGPPEPSFKLLPRAIERQCAVNPLLENDPSVNRLGSWILQLEEWRHSLFDWGLWNLENFIHGISILLVY